MIPINIEEKFSLIKDYWKPKIIAQLNDQEVKIAKVKGEFVWHNHANEDELFYIVKGNLEIQLKDTSLFLKKGEIGVIPKGVEHKPIARKEVWIMLFEPSETKNTGNVTSDLTVNNCEIL